MVEDLDMPIKCFNMTLSAKPYNDSKWTCGFKVDLFEDISSERAKTNVQLYSCEVLCYYGFLSWQLIFNLSTSNVIFTSMTCI